MDNEQLTHTANSFFKALKASCLALIIVHCPLSIVHSHAATYEFDIYYGIGWPDFDFNNAPIAVSVYPWKHFGFSSGIEYSKRKKTSSEENIKSKIDLIDNDGDNLVLNYTMDKYKDELSAQMLLVPILLKYKSKWVYAAAGVKLGIPQNVRVKISYKGFETEGCLTDFEICLDDLPHMSFGKQKDDSFETQIKAKMLTLLAGECGIRIGIGNSFAFILGAFTDYSLNKGFNRSLRNAVEWEQYTDGANVNVNDSWKSWQPWSVGGLAKLSFGFGGKQ